MRSAVTTNCTRWWRSIELSSGAMSPLQCGLVWFLHVSKSGGTTVANYLGRVAPQNGWKFVNLWTSDDELRSGWRTGTFADSVLRNASTWTQSEQWRPAAEELQRARPRVVVHQHHGSPGLGQSLLQPLQGLKRGLRAKGCDLLLATVLREPGAHMRSMLFYIGVPAAALRPFVANLSDYQAKYIMHGHEFGWPAPFTPWVVGSRAATATPALLQKASAALEHFDLVGRTDELQSFLAALTQRLAGWPALDRVRHDNAVKKDLAQNIFDVSTSDMRFICKHSAGDAVLYWRNCATRLPQEPPRKCGSS